jgi:hypothetical protein
MSLTLKVAHGDLLWTAFLLLEHSDRKQHSMSAHKLTCKVLVLTLPAGYFIVSNDSTLRGFFFAARNSLANLNRVLLKNFLNDWIM